MNRKLFIVGIVIAIAAGLTWLGRMVYRKTNNLVSLDVYSAPLAEVVKRLERQTGETILAGKDLETRVTLSLKNVSLEVALDRLGQQAGANWSRWHAVHDSGRALSQLEAALRDRAALTDAGWTNLVRMEFPDGPGVVRVGGGPSDTPPTDGLAGSSGEVVVTKRKPVTIRLNSQDIKNGDVAAAVREQLRAAGVDESVIAQAGPAIRQQTLDVDVQATGGGSNRVVHAGGSPDRIRMITRTRDGSGQMTEEVWSPQHLVLEQRLHPKLGGELFPEANEATARSVAEKAKANLTTLYVLRKSPGGFSFGGRMMRRVGHNGHSSTNGVPGQPPVGEPPPLPDIESLVRRAEAENYVRLTPEQRVQRAREKQAARSKQP